jgi:lipopolysaccharide biosynthesis glycosyltransferase/predicted Zn-dependent protease
MSINPNMSVAVFFRDKRVQAALTGPRSKQTAQLVEEFFAAYDYTDCSAAQLLALADLSMRCGNAEVAQQALLRVIETGSKQHLAYYKYGRLLLSQAQPDKAAAQFELGAQAEPSFPHNFMGAARALHECGIKDQAATYAERFATFAVPPHVKQDLVLLADLADYLFDSGRRDRALPIYAMLHAQGADCSRGVVRLAEARIAAGEFDLASSMLQAQVTRTGTDKWNDRALALCHSQEGNHTAALELALRALRADPNNQGFIGTYVRVLGRSGNAATIRDALAEHAGLLTAQDVAELTARLQLLDNDPAAAAATLAAAQIIPETRLFYLSFEAAYAALTAGHVAAADILTKVMEAAAPDFPMVKVLRIDICFRRLQWEEAGKILATLPQAENERPQIAMKRLEYACFTGDRDTAAGAATRLEILAATAGRHIMLPVFRYYAEQQDWNGVVDRALPWIDASLDYLQIGYVLFRAAKHTGRQAAVLDAIQAVPDWAAHTGLLNLRNTLAYDVARTVEDFEKLLADPALDANMAMRRKLAVRRDVRARASTARNRQAVFLCTDRNYLCATIVALHSMKQAVNLRGNDFYIVADDDAVTLARASTRAFSDAGMSLTVVPASEITGAAARMLPAYGLFTSGHRLASAAYYRIYFAQYLKKLGVHDRALYVDSDTLLNGPLDSLWRYDLAGQPAAARLETMRPEVQRAISHHGLIDDRYFNSGVLLLDLKHPDLPGALANAIAAVADDKVTLLYHDQCALNIGFRTGFTELQKSWNYPVTETTRLADIPADIGLLHFLDRPKPWSAAYGGEAGPLWFEKWQETADFIGEAAAVALFAEVKD